MEKDVLLTISGLQFQAGFEEDEENTPIEMITAGNYYKKNGKHYVLYEEVMEGMVGVTKNTIKIQDKMVEVVKRGTTNVHLKFEKDKKNMSCYDTPFGNLLVGTQASQMDIKVMDDDISVKVDYTLEVNYEYVAECCIDMRIKSKDAQNFNISEA